MIMILEMETQIDRLVEALKVDGSGAATDSVG